MSGGPSWTQRAACKGVDVEVFVGPDPRQALTFCDRCQVRVACLEDCLSFVAYRLPGVWGGTIREDRRNPDRARVYARVGRGQQVA